MVASEENSDKWYLTCVLCIIARPKLNYLSNPAALELLVLTEDQLVGKTF
jgi:hypothetical protein